MKACLPVGRQAIAESRNMKHIRTRRRFKCILIVCLVLSFLLFIEARIEAVLPQLKNLVESKLEEMTAHQVKVSIGSLDGGIIRPLSLHDIVLRDKNGNAIFPFVQITSIVSNYRAWDTLSNMLPADRRPAIFVSRPYFIVNFTTKGREAIGYARIESSEDGSLKSSGSVKLFKSERIDFIAEAKLDTFRMECRPKAGSFSVEVSVPSDTDTLVRLALRRLRLGRNDIIGNIAVDNKAVKAQADEAGGQGYFKGTIAADGIMLNDRPLFDMKGSYKISEGRFDISDFRLGKDFVANGTIGLRPPYPVNMVLTADNVSMNRMLGYFDAQDGLVLSGVMSGKFELSGPLRKARLIARMDVKQGNLGPIDFDHLSASLRGEGPFIRIEDARVSRKSGYFSLEGDIDLRKSGRSNVFENIQLTSDDRAIMWDDWNATRWQDVSELRMNKKVTEDLNMGFTKFFSDDRVDESFRQSDKIEFEYNLQANDSLKLEVGQDSNFLGLQHKDKF